MSGLRKYTWLIITAGMLSYAVQATDLNISGNVVATPCSVDTNSVRQIVDFGQLRSTDLKIAGSGSDWKPFQVQLNNCPVSTRQATVTFSGTPSTDDATLFANSGSAVNLAVQMAQDANHAAVLSNGSSMTVSVDAQHMATYALAGRLYSVNGNTVAGTFTSVVQMNFTYQ